MMIGVVLWSSSENQKAVFWCEDQGDLAYYTTAPDEGDHLGLFSAGDMVQFDVSTEQNYRKAHNPRLIQENACQGIQGHLRDTAQRPEQTAARPSPSNVVDLNARRTPSRSELARAGRQF